MLRNHYPNSLKIAEIDKIDKSCNSEGIELLKKINFFRGAIVEI